MRVLQICSKRPYPPTDGGSIAMDQITRGLIEKGHQVKVVAIDPLMNNEEARAIPGEYISTTGFQSHYIDTGIKVLPAFLNLFSGKSYNVQRFHDKGMEQLLENILRSNSFDIIQLEGLYLTPYIRILRKFSKAPVIYRSHNIEHFIWERMAAASNNFFKKRYLGILARKLKKYEMEVIHQADGLAAISPNDLNFFKENGYTKPSILIPVGIPLQDLENEDTRMVQGSVYHLGSMDWRPNQEGVEWFLERVWPLVIKENKNLKFYLAGKNMPERYRRYASENVEVVGEVPDATEFFLPLEIMVVPLLSGGGMRVKIIEGMAYGKMIISTTIGAEGIGCTDGENILIADSPVEMARKILLCMRDKEIIRSTGEKARKFVKENYATQAIIKNLIEFYKGFSNKK